LKTKQSNCNIYICTTRHERPKKYTAPGLTQRHTPSTAQEDINYTEIIINKTIKLRDTSKWPQAQLLPVARDKSLSTDLPGYFCPL